MTEPLAQQGNGVDTRLGLKKTNSRYVSEAFSFLNNSEYEDIDENARNSFLEFPNIEAKHRYSGFPRSDNGELSTKKGVVSNEQPNGEFTIITSVANSPPPKCSSRPFVSNDQGNNYISPLNGEEDEVDDGQFRIVTYMQESKVHSASNDTKLHKTINPVYDTRNQLDPSSDIKQTETENKPRADRNSVIVEGELVELRKSPNERPLSRHSRLPTWRSNQNVVSEAFGFLTDITDLDDANVELGENIDADNADGLITTDTSVSDSDQINGAHGYAKTKLLVKGAAFDDNISDNQSIDKTPQRILHQHTPVGSSETLTGSDPSLISQGKVVGSGETSEVSYSGSSENDELGELKGIRKRGGRKDHSENGEDDGGSSDEDTGVYRESFRKSTWLYIGDNSDIKKNNINPANYVALADLGISTCETDSIFGDDTEPPESPATPSGHQHHKRNESTATTASEMNFKNHYNSVRKRFVQRQDSQLEYRRYTASLFDNVKSFTIEKNVDAGFGIHLLDSKPAVISGIDAESPAELAGVQEGQVVISVNGINVLESDHDEIIQLVHENSTQLVLDVGCGDVSNIVDLQVPVRTGYLQKQVSSVIFKSWKRRFFILRRDNCLYYYKNEHENDPLGAIPLNGFTFSRHGDINKFGFKAEKYGSKTFYFMADSRDSMTSWVGDLNNSAQLCNNKQDTWMDVTTNNVGLPALDIRKPDCSGYLYKMGRATKRWRKRYCVLKDACIYHYRNSNSKEADGVAHLHGYTVDDNGVTGKKNSFCLYPPEPQMRVFSFYTDNATDKMRWVHALDTSIQKWVRVDLKE